MMSPSDAIKLARPCNSLFEFQVVHRYVFIVILFKSGVPKLSLAIYP